MPSWDWHKLQFSNLPDNMVPASLKIDSHGLFLTGHFGELPDRYYNGWKTVISCVPLPIFKQFTKKKSTEGLIKVELILIRLAFPMLSLPVLISYQHRVSMRSKTDLELEQPHSCSHSRLLYLWKAF